MCYALFMKKNKAISIVFVLISILLVSCNKKEEPVVIDGVLNTSNIDKDNLSIDIFLLGEPTLNISPLMQKYELPPWTYDEPKWADKRLYNVTPDNLKGTANMYKLCTFETYLEYEKHIYQIDNGLSFGGYGASHFAHVHDGKGFDVLFSVCSWGSGHHQTYLTAFNFKTKTNYQCDQRFDHPDSIDETGQLVDFMFVYENNTLNLYRGYYDVEQFELYEDAKATFPQGIRPTTLEYTDIFNLEFKIADMK